jgi:opacity protein-like surface antigen
MKFQGHLSIALALAASTAGFASAQTPSPCPGDPQRHHFDFWIGQWDVTTKEGKQVGTSRIESIAGGCAILENWSAGRGGSGKSINAYNPTLKQWQQYWVGSDGEILDYQRSEFDGKSMIFLITGPTNPAASQRLTFTPLDSNTVRQHSEKSTDGGTTWITEYDFYYHRSRALTP